MKPRLEFIVPGPVAPSGRVRKIPFHKPGGGLGVRGVTPAKSDSYMDHVATHALLAAARVPEWRMVVANKWPVRVQMHIVREKWVGDIDNLEKNVLDGLGRSGQIFFNDNRVIQVSKSIFTRPGAAPRAELVIDTCNPYLDKPLWMQIALEEGWRPPGAAEGSVSA